MLCTEYKAQVQICHGFISVFLIPPEVYIYVEDIYIIMYINIYLYILQVVPCKVAA